MDNTGKSTLAIARTTLLDASGITDCQLENAMGHLLGGGIDAADIYFQAKRSEGWFLEEGIVKEGSFAIERGVGVRAMSREKTGFAFSEDVNIQSLIHAADAARSIAQHGDSGAKHVLAPVDRDSLYLPTDPLQSISDTEKIALLQRLDKHLRAKDARVEQVMASLTGSHEVVLVANSDGTLGSDVRPLVRLNVQVIVAQDGRRETGSYGGGGRHGYTTFLDSDQAIEYANEALRVALVNLEAQPAPAGTMPVVLGPGWPGVLLHEAVGHGLEGDFNRKQTSVFSGRLGQQVASPLCTVVDDGTLSERRGSLNIDDEGTPTQQTVLIENGILKNYMQDKLNARLMGMSPTGNGRRESYAHVPMPRMTNTYMLAGEHNSEEMIQSVKKGIYAVNFSGGQVDITSGNFVFSTSEAYLIESGKIVAPVKGATLIGNGPDVIRKISMVGNDMALDSGIGMCGKEGQGVPVGVGQPTLKVDAVTVGGTG